MDRACIRPTGAWCRISSMQALRNENITIYGEGQQTRSFCYVDDLVEGLIRLMETPDDVTRSRQSWQPGRVHDPAARRARDRATRAHRRRSFFIRCRRDDPKQRCPGHQPCQVGARMVHAESSFAKVSRERLTISICSVAREEGVATGRRLAARHAGDSARRAPIAWSGHRPRRAGRLTSAPRRYRQMPCRCMSSGR